MVILKAIGKPLHRSKTIYPLNCNCCGCGDCRNMYLNSSCSCKNCNQHQRKRFVIKFHSIHQWWLICIPKGNIVNSFVNGNLLFSSNKFSDFYLFFGHPSSYFSQFNVSLGFNLNTKIQNHVGVLPYKILRSIYYDSIKLFFEPPPSILRLYLHISLHCG